MPTIGTGRAKVFGCSYCGEAGEECLQPAAMAEEEEVLPEHKMAPFCSCSI